METLKLKFDAFLSYNRRDNVEVEYIAQRLREAGLNPFLDKWHLIPGEPWQEALEYALENSNTVVVFVVYRVRTCETNYEILKTKLDRELLDDLMKFNSYVSRRSRDLRPSISFAQEVLKDLEGKTIEQVIRASDIKMD